jgi:hypothetical protein
VKHCLKKKYFYKLNIPKAPRKIETDPNAFQVYIPWVNFGKNTVGSKREKMSSELPALTKRVTQLSVSRFTNKTNSCYLCWNKSRSTMLCNHHYVVSEEFKKD